ncbi:hypothetical protein BH09VER1_BH09VER1_18790 [soil metagenome]
MDEAGTAWSRPCWDLQTMQADLLSIAAGLEQIPSIVAAQKMGFSVLAMDGNPEAPGLKVADRGVNINARDFAAAEEIARQAQIKALLPIPIGALLAVAGRLNTSLHLPGPQTHAAKLCTDKYLQRQVLLGADLPQPSFFLVRDRREILEAAARINGRVVVKPRFGSGSKAVFVAETSQELLDLLPWHFGNEAEVHSLVESYVEGTEYGVDAAITRGEFHLLAIRGKELTPLPYRVNRGFFLPVVASQEHLDTIAETCRCAVNAVGLDDCLVHFDVVLSPENKAFVIELSGRPSGYNISAKMLPAALGFSPIEEMTKHLLGRASDFAAKTSRGAVLRMLAVAPGKVESISGLAEAISEPGVVALETFLSEGLSVEASRDGTSAYQAGYLITDGETLEAAEMNWQRAASRLKIKTQP